MIIYNKESDKLSKKSHRLFLMEDTNLMAHSGVMEELLVELRFNNLLILIKRLYPHSCEAWRQMLDDLCPDLTGILFCLLCSCQEAEQMGHYYF